MSGARQWLQRDVSSGGLGKGKKNRFLGFGRREYDFWMFESNNVVFTAWRKWSFLVGLT